LCEKSFFSHGTIKTREKLAAAEIGHVARYQYWATYNQEAGVVKT
jgi:hypothetical protein